MNNMKILVDLDMNKPLNNISNLRGSIIYVVIALQEGEIKEQVLFASLFEADECFRKLFKIYGGGSVILSSRRVK